MTHEEALNLALTEPLLDLECSDPRAAANFRRGCFRVRSKDRETNKKPEEVIGRSIWDSLTIIQEGEKLSFRTIQPPRVVINRQARSEDWA